MARTAHNLELLSRTNWWLIGAFALGFAFWIAVIAVGRAII